MKLRVTCLMLFALLATSISTAAQETQIAVSFILRQQTHLGYEPANVGLKIEGDYKLPRHFTIVGYATGIRSPKVDSGTGKSGFLSLGARWDPVAYKGVRFFGEFDAILGALVTDPYRKTIFHFRNALGVKLLDGRLLLDVARLYQDLLPDAAKLLKERGFDPSALHTTFNQLSGWDYEGQYWTRPLKEGSRWGMKGALRYSTSKFVRSQAGDLGHGWLMQFEIGPYWKF